MVRTIPIRRLTITQTDYAFYTKLYAIELYERDQARMVRDFVKADGIKTMLEAKGVPVHEIDMYRKGPLRCLWRAE